MKSSATLIHINVCNFEETLGHCKEREYFNYIGSPGICAKSHPTGIEPLGKHRDGGLDLSLLKVCLSIYILIHKHCLHPFHGSLPQIGLTLRPHVNVDNDRLSVVR